MAKFALLIGVGNYEHPDQLKPLVCAPKDVAAMQRILLNPEMGDFTEVIPLIDPDKRQMEEAIETLYRDRAKDDLILLFFSGHGIKDDSGKLHFATRLTSKTPKGELKQSTALPASFVHEIMGKSLSRRQVMILDCCFSGAFDPQLNPKDDGSVDVRGQLGAAGRVVLTSSSSTEYSFEQQGSELSIYTRFLVEGIETGAADRDNHGKVSVRELHDYATKKVQETAPKMNPQIIVLKDKGYEVVFAKAHITDPKLKYRRNVERYSSRGEISPVGRTSLNVLQVRLGLTLEETQEIEVQVLQPFRERLKHLETYGSTFVAAVEHQYPLTEETLNELKDLHESLGLRKQDVTQIEEEVTAAYGQKLQRYQQALTRAIQAGFPLSQPVCEELDKFQADLGLRDENVRRIKQPIIERRTAEYKQQQLEQQRQQTENLRQRQEVERLQQQEAKRLKERAKQQKEKLESQPAKLQKRDEVKQQKKSSQTKENVRSSSSNKLRLAGAFLSSILITAGGLFYFNSTRPQPQLIVQPSISTPPTPPTQSFLPTQFVLAKAQAIAKGGDKGRAIKLAQSVSGTQASDAQSSISQWQSEWYKEQDAFDDFKTAYNSKRWQEAYYIAYKSRKIPYNKYWNNHPDLYPMAIYAKSKWEAQKAEYEKQRKAEAERSRVSAELDAIKRAEYLPKIEPGINQISESERPSPEEFIKYYYTQTRNGDTTKTTWELLTKAFQEEKSPGGFREYHEFCLKKQQEVLDVKIIQQTPESAEVTALLVYQDGEKRITSRSRSRWHLIWDSSDHTWKIDLPPPNNSMQGG
ncbi:MULTISPECIES: caspase family protein [unclassified Microcoleus]|uniref:caspase family protein n=1 Tax=unclassified Microcoleus TaxID=2642155 RepID=UPI0025E1ABDB|nr:MULTISPECIES: caspase family protein [unclassified Microcoleus]